jgi:ABC-type multidrug transport system ATPase subunit
VQAASASLFHFRQEGADALVGPVSAFQALWERTGGDAAGVSAERVYRVMKQLGLPRSVQHTPLDALSGGERARLYLAQMLLSRATLLVLDEPTNHLDLRARAFLQEALRQFDGAVLLTSHDRFFAAGLATRCVVLDGDGGVVEVSDTADGAAEYARAYGLALRTEPAQPRGGGSKRRRGKGTFQAELATVATSSASESRLGYSMASSGGYALGEDGSAWQRTAVDDDDGKAGRSAPTRSAGVAADAAARKSEMTGKRGKPGRTKKAKGTPFWKNLKDSKKGRS